MIKRFFKRLIGNWWIVGSAKPYYPRMDFVPINYYRMIVLEPYVSKVDCQKRCDGLNAR